MIFLRHFQLFQCRWLDLKASNGRFRRLPPFTGTGAKDPLPPKTDPGAGHQASDFIHTGARSFSRNAPYCLGRYRVAIPEVRASRFVQHHRQVAKPVLDPGKPRLTIARNELIRLSTNREAIKPREPLLLWCVGADDTLYGLTLGIGLRAAPRPPIGFAGPTRSATSRPSGLRRSVGGRPSLNLPLRPL